MQIFCIILCGLALLAAVTCLTLFFREKKRNEKRRAATIKLIQEECGDVAEKAYERYRQLQYKLDKIAETVEAFQKKIADLESGVIPDYEAARQAAEAVDEFNQGLSNILGFDPMEVARKARQSTGGDS